MASLHLVQVRPEIKSLLRFLRDQGLDAKNSSEDLGYGVHAWLKAAFGHLAPQPWRLLVDRRRPPRILGYSNHSAEELRRYMREFADPGVFAVCPDLETAIEAREMPDWKPGRRLGFELQCCPVGRKARTGVEKDLFLIQSDGAKGQPLKRESIYCDWVRDRLQRGGATEVNTLRLEGFRLVHQTRKSQKKGSDRRRTRLVRPQALLRGELVIRNADTFSKLLSHGIGRHRSFGYGMLLLRPPS